MNAPTRPKIVIVGAGFGGLTAAKALSRLPVHVTLVDRRNYHTFQPLLYQVATAGLSPAEIAAPIRVIMADRKNVDVLLGEVESFDLEKRKVQLRGFELDYDYLLVAAGATHAYFGHDDWELVAPGLKTIEDALEIRRRFLLAFELADREAALTGKQSRLNFVVVGGGPTGVELAGTLAEIARKSLPKNFRHIQASQVHILLVEAGPAVLGTYTPDLQRSAVRQLEQLGVEVRTNSAVTEVRSGEVRIGDEVVPAEVILWAAGVAASPNGSALGVPTDRHGRVLVEPDLSIPGHREVFVVGDLATLKDKDGKPLPGVAPVAIQEGKHVARQIASDMAGRARQDFHYFDKGSLATIGRAAAIAQIGKIHLSGLLAWLTWLFVHIMYLIGFRNRIIVMLQWAWSYFTFQRAAWLITGASRTVAVPSIEYAERARASAEKPAEGKSPPSAAAKQG